MPDDRTFCYPIRETFSRQQVHERTGIADDVLAFWIKQGLLVALPAERRAHRRFSYEQLHIAVVLNAMRSLGANIGILRKFSAALQNGFVTWRESGFAPQSLSAASTLCERLDRFSRGEPVELRASADDYRRAGFAASTADVVQSWLWDEVYEGATEELANFAKSLTLQMARSVRWAIWLTDPSYLMLDGSSPDSDAWIAWIDEAGDPRFAEGNELILRSENGPLAAFYIPIRKLILRLWPERLEAARERRRIRQHNSTIRRLMQLEDADPVEARRYRQRLSIPDDWAETYHLIEEDNDMTG